MKCLKCSADNKLSDRTNGRCARCNHQICFDPRRTAGDKFNDIQFSKTLEVISQSGSLKFTEKQFYYFLNSRKVFQNLSGVAGLTLILALVVFVGIINNDGLGEVKPICAFSVVLIEAVILFVIKRQKRLRPKEVVHVVDVSKGLERWARINGKIECLLPDADRLIARNAELPVEILDYSFDRIIVTQSDDIAHFLIANNFHFENNCAVLSINQYPRELFETIMKMLRNNPELKVYALHDASWNGIAMLEKLRNDPFWFAEQSGVQIIDLGLLPRQFEKRKRPLFIEDGRTMLGDGGGLQNAVSDALRKTLSQNEIDWLNKGNIVRLESIAPQGLMRMINMGIARSRDPEKKDALVPVDSSGGASDGMLFVYSSDSFG